MKRQTAILTLAVLACTAVPVFAGPVPERATFNSAGALTSLITDGMQLPLTGELVVTFDGGVRQTLQPADQRSPITREGEALHWKGVAIFPNGGQAQFDAAWAVAPTGTVSVDATALSGAPALPGAPAHRWPLQVRTVEYDIDLPRATFKGWSYGGQGATLPAVHPANPEFYRAKTDRIQFVDPARNRTLTLVLDQARDLSVTDLWEGDTRAYRIRIRLGGGEWAPGDALKLGLEFSFTGRGSAPDAHVTVDPADRRYPFAGFGGDYCFDTRTPAADYMLDHVRNAWARLEFKAQAWERERGHPGPELVRDFELMQRMQQRHIPWILSLWRLPEHFYTDPNQKPFGTFGRRIAPDRWPEFLDLLGSYLVYLKTHYGAEPDLFSFNEPDLGVSIGFTPEQHRDAIVRIGAYLKSLGLKTRMLLGDTANPRGTHHYVLATAADPEAMRYVGAISFHSWGGGTPEQYRAWADVARWLRLPLIVAEAGVDPGAYRNHAYDSYSYGLEEAAQFQQLLRYARPEALVYWEFTEDYGLVHVRPDKSIGETGRYWLLRQFANLTPPNAEALGCASDRSDVLVSAFSGGDGRMVVHVLNLGPSRDLVLSGLPTGAVWSSETTTELEGGRKQAAVDVAAPVHLAARSLTTFVRD